MKQLKTYSVGQIAELCNISSKQLRYFDEKNIIVPAIRDQNNRYRYYTEKQIAEILLVKEMRQLGIPLNRIAHLLSNRDLTTLQQELHAWLNDAREEINHALSKYDKTLELVFRLMNVRDFLTPALSQESNRAGSFSLAEIEAREIVFTRYPGYYSANVSFINRRAELYGIIENYNLATTGPNMAIFHNGYLQQFYDEIEKCRIDLEIFMVLKNNNSHCPHCRRQQSFKAGAAVYVGPYRNLKQVYLDLEGWLLGQGLKIQGSSIEEYIVGATHTNSEENYITRILLPLAGYQP